MSGTNHPSSCTCGCCEGISKSTPQAIENKPGLSELAYRIGEHGTFKESMQTALSEQSALDNLTTRTDDDFSMAMIDSSSVVLDVLSFYQERIANEGYIRTATERRSVLELSNTIGYQLNPGVASSAYLAFEMDSTEGAPETVTLEEGTKVQSIPKQDETPQLFETIEEIVARQAWNAMTLRLRTWKTPEIEDKTFYLKGIGLVLKPGDPVLIVGDERIDDSTNENWDMRRIVSVDEDFDTEITKVTLNEGIGHVASATQPAKSNPKFYVFRKRAGLFGFRTLEYESVSYDSDGDGDVDDDDATYYLPSVKQAAKYAAGTTEIALDAVYDEVAVDSWIVLNRGKSGVVTPWKELFLVTGVNEIISQDEATSEKTTQLKIAGELIEYFSPSDSTVFCQSELLELVDEPVDVASELSNRQLVLDDTDDDLEEGQKIAISGTLKSTGEKASEIAEIDSLDELTENRPPNIDEDDDSYEATIDLTRITLTEDLKNEYKPSSIKVNANIAKATHGETKFEILGSGDASTPNQKFVLSNTPLTYVPDTSSSGGSSTVKLRVNSILWDEVKSLYTEDSEDESYSISIDDDANAYLKFGDGIKGSRLPSGSNNVTVEYRAGLGDEGNLDADQISLLMSRPLGLKAATNPEKSSGGVDPESRDKARDNAPRSILTLERVVSLKDFEDYAFAYTGIGKAQANWIWDGQNRIVHLTVTGDSGAAVSADLEKRLKDALDAVRDPFQLIEIDALSDAEEENADIILYFEVEVKILVDEAYIYETVEQSVKETLVETFSFDKRSFAQSVSPSEVIAAIQSVDGIVAADLDKLYRSDEGDTGIEPTTLLAKAARHDDSSVPSKNLPAELLLIKSKDSIQLSTMTVK